MTTKGAAETEAYLDHVERGIDFAERIIELGGRGEVVGMLDAAYDYLMDLDYMAMKQEEWKTARHYLITMMDYYDAARRAGFVTQTMKGIGND